MMVPAPHSGGPPFRRSAIPGVRVRVSVRVSVRVNPSGPADWRTGINNDNSSVQNCTSGAMVKCELRKCEWVFCELKCELNIR